MEDKLLSWYILEDNRFEEYKLYLERKKLIDCYEQRIKQLLDIRDEINASLVKLHEGLSWLELNKKYLCILLTSDIESSHFDASTIVLNTESHNHLSNILNQFKEIYNNFDSYNDLATHKPNIDINKLKDDIVSVMLKFNKNVKKISTELKLLEDFKNNIQLVNEFCK